MINIVKKALRVSTNSFDDDITNLINACLFELTKNGIATSDTEYEDYIKMTVIAFCKAKFGNNPDADKYLQQYEQHKAYLMGISRGADDV